MKPTFVEIVKLFESKLNRKLTDAEYRVLYSNFVKSSKNRK
jgi:hypothetical protein